MRVLKIGGCVALLSGWYGFFLWWDHQGRIVYFPFLMMPVIASALLGKVQGSRLAAAMGIITGWLIGGDKLLTNTAWVGWLAYCCAATAVTFLSNRWVKAEVGLEDATEAIRVTTILQDALLPPPYNGPLRATTRYRPAMSSLAFGGDFIDLTTRKSDAMVCFVVGDVCGRGPRAAAMGAAFRAAWRSKLRRYDRPQDWAEALHRLVTDDDWFQDGYFTTCLLGLYDPFDHTLEFTSCGHPWPILITQDGAREIEFPTNLPLGIEQALIDDSGWTTYRTEFPEGSRLLLYSDGLTDCKLSEREDTDDRLGIERLVPWLTANAHLGAEELADELLRFLDHTCHDLDDDLTFMILERRDDIIVLPEELDDLSTADIA